MKNLNKIGVNTICYNWMPVISWARTDFARKGRGGALVTAFDYETHQRSAIDRIRRSYGRDHVEEHGVLFKSSSSRS